MTNPTEPVQKGLEGFYIDSSLEANWYPHQNRTSGIFTSHDNKLFVSEDVTFELASR